MVLFLSRLEIIFMIKKIFLITAFSLLLVFGVFKTVSAQNTPPGTEGCTFNEGVEKCQLENPIGATEVPDIIRIVITAALSLIGAFTLLMLVWGGFQWLTSAGNPEKVTAGTQTMVWAIIGVMVVLASYVLLSTFLDFLTRG